PLALDGTGGNVYRDNLANGAPHPHSVGEIVQTQPGNMVGPTTQAIDAPFPPASGEPYPGDDWTNLHPHNPRLVILPLVDWKSIKNGRADIEILGFAAFWITRCDKGDVYGRFVRIVTQGTVGPGETTFDAGLYSARLTE